MDKKDSWLKPDGSLIEVGQAWHNDYASELLKREFKDKFLDRTLRINKYPYQVLHERGWVRVKYRNSNIQRIQILGDCIDLTRPMRNTMGPPMNERQLETAKRLCEEVNTTLHIAINDKRFW